MDTSTKKVFYFNRGGLNMGVMFRADFVFFDSNNTFLMHRLESADYLFTRYPYFSLTLSIENTKIMNDESKRILSAIE